VKAYTPRVGGGPFPTELTDDVGDRLRKVGAEFGSVTGRPRRTGWIDLPALRYAARINGLDAIALTKLDVLTGLSTVKACVAYDTPGGVTDELPLDDLDHATPRYEELPGWSADLGAARAMGDLPLEARRYVRFLEEAIGVPITLVSVGQRRDETIVVCDPWAGA
jgi:adenylosuccinate synthase